MRRCAVSPLVLLFTLSVLSAGCGSSSPSTPSAPAVAEVAGVWRGTARLNSITGGDCVGPVLQGAVGTSLPFTASITQGGASLSATVTDPSTGGSCTYNGTMGSSALTLNVNGCTSSNIFGIRCANGASRDVILVSGAINGTVTGNSITGTEAETYNVLVS